MFKMIEHIKTPSEQIKDAALQKGLRDLTKDTKAARRRQDEERFIKQRQAINEAVSFPASFRFFSRF